MKVSFIIPDYVTDHYGRSAFHLMHEHSRFESVVNQCDESCDIVFCTSAGCLFSMSSLYLSLRRKFPNKIFVNYLWDLPFWRMDPAKHYDYIFTSNIYTNIKNLFRKNKVSRLLMNKNWRELYKLYFDVGDMVLCSSNHTKSEVKRYYGVDYDVLYLFFPNTDTDDILYNGEKRDQVIYVGRIEEYKQVDVLIKAMSKVRERTKLVIVGQGSKRQECMAIAERLKVNVEFRGYLGRADMLEEIMNSKLFVSPSVMEGNPGWGPCEAVWAGTPAIMADIPDTREFFKDKAVYFTKDDPDSLADKINLLLNDSNLREKVQIESKKQISFYTVENGILRLEKALMNIIHNCRASS